MAYRIDWKSTSNWAGTTRTECEGEDTFQTREEAEAALKEFEDDMNYMQEVHDQAVQGQGVQGYLEVVEAK